MNKKLKQDRLKMIFFFRVKMPDVKHLNMFFETCVYTPGARINWLLGASEMYAT